MKTTIKEFGKLADGTQIFLCTLAGGKTQVNITNYGGRITKLLYDGVSVVCGFDCLEGVLADGDYHGSTVGRYANRISDGKFTLGGKEYVLNCNEAARGEHLHGGNVGYSARVWNIGEVVTNDDSASVTLTLHSPDGEEGYPGALDIAVTFTLKNDALSIDYKATTDADTIINMTNHAYFSLSGVGHTIRDHHLVLNCDKYVPVNERLIPFGDFAPVAGTPFDFTAGKTIGTDIDADDVQIKTAGGYDHCFVRNNGVNTEKPELIGSISSPVTNIKMDILTTEGGIQMYTGNFMTASNPFFGNITQKANEAVALECNAAPDSPNQKNFPSVVLKAGDTYTQTTVYKFSKI